MTAPTLVYPINTEQNYPRSGRIQWKHVPSASAYVIQVDSTPNFVSGATFLTLQLSDTTLSIPNLKAQSTYYWRAAAGGQANSSNYSSAFSFRTGWPLPPTALSPPVANGISLTPTFSWTGGGGTSFELKVTDYAARIVLVDTTVTDTTCTLTRSLDGFKIYSWIVLASNAYGSGDWSAESRFRTTDATLVETTSGAPTTYDLSQNYPNPFNPVTTIRFVLPKTGITKLVIYDLLGREVTSLVNEVLLPGVYRAHFDADRMTSGTYFYVLTSGTTRLVKKMIYLK